MLIKNDHKQHPLVFAEGILGLLGYSPDGLWTTVADGGNHFFLHGITENSLLVVDRKLPYEEGKLNVFQTDKVIGGGGMKAVINETGRTSLHGPRDFDDQLVQIKKAG